MTKLEELRAAYEAATYYVDEPALAAWSDAWDVKEDAMRAYKAALAAYDAADVAYDAAEAARTVAWRDYQEELNKSKENSDD
jgi:hypothetical protein